MRISHLIGIVVLTGLFTVASMPATAGILDVLPAAEAAYSLRQLSSAYTGPAVQVQVGGNTQDIGFVNGQLDTGSLLTFAGSGTAYVTTWYDQTGGGQHVTRTSGTLPRIVSSGNLVLNPVTDLPAIRFSGTSLRRLHDDNDPWNPWNSTMSVFTAASWVGVPNDSNSLAQRLWTMQYNNSTRASAGGDLSKFSLAYPDSAGTGFTWTRTGTDIVQDEPFVLSYLSDTTGGSGNGQVYLYQNGDSIWSRTNLTLGGATPNNFFVGAQTDTDRRFDGIMHELILFHSLLSPEDRALAEHSLMRYVPEPGSLLLLLVGGLAVLARRRRR